MKDETFLPRRPIPAHVTKNDAGATVLRICCDPHFAGGDYKYVDYSLAIPADPLQRRTYQKALLSTMPRRFKLKEGLESQAMGAIESTLERRAWEGDKPRPESTKASNGCSARDRKKVYSVKSKAAKLFNHLWKRVVAESADPEARRIALRYPPSSRWGIYQECALSPRFRQLCEAFPLLAAELVKHNACERDMALDAIKDGEPLREIAERAQLPLHLRKLHPCCSIFLTHERWPTAQMMQFCPRQALKQYRWMRAFIELSEFGEDQQLRAWVAQRADLSLKANALAIQVAQIRDWYREAATPDPRFSWQTAVERSATWHRELQVRTADQLAAYDKKHAAIAQQPFPEPWLEGGPVGAFEMVPLRTSNDLAEEGRLMGHCVGGYANLVRQGYSYIYGVRHGDERVATLELQRQGAGLKIVQLHGPRNTEPSAAVKSATRRWFAKRTAAPSASVGFAIERAS